MQKSQESKMDIYTNRRELSGHYDLIAVSGYAFCSFFTLYKTIEGLCDYF